MMREIQALARISLIRTDTDTTNGATEKQNVIS